jgi:hypothetical protein
LQPRALPQPWLLCFFSSCLRKKRRRLLVYVESPVNAIPKRSHADATQKFPRFPRLPQFPLVTSWATCQAREHYSASQLTITTFGCSDASIRESSAMCLECLRHSSPSTSLWLPFCPGKSRRATVPSASKPADGQQTLHQFRLILYFKR